MVLLFFVGEGFQRFIGLCYLCNIVRFFLYLPIRQAMKCDGSFVIVINLSISLFYSQAGGFFVFHRIRFIKLSACRLLMKCGIILNKVYSI